MTSSPTLIHGFTGSSASWGSLVDGLASAGRTPVLADLPGHGRYASDRVCTLETALERIGEAGAWPDVLIGYSMGGRVALHFATTFPDRVTGLVLESASPGLAHAIERAKRMRVDEELAERIETEGVEAFVDAWEQLPLFESQQALPSEVLAAQRVRRLANDPAGLAASLRGLGTGALPPLWHELEAVETPTLLLVGELDTKFVRIAQEMSEVMPAATLVVVSGCGHAVHLERPAAWLEAVTDFLVAH